ncbi:hypothetical protein FRB97_004418 [Tulasnella sp. 331]|nr:hypothetical protein FRB97_004418 [Tulasnella sp. 331]
MPSTALKPPPKPSSSSWAPMDDDLDDEGWQDMPVVRVEENPLGLDDDEVKKYHYVAPKKFANGSSTLGPSKPQGNATGNLIDFDDSGNEWRAKLEQNEDDYTRLRLDDDEEADDAYLRTKYLFDEDKAMTPLSQMQQTKNLLTEGQRIAYVGLCALAIREMSQELKKVGSKELKVAGQKMDLWGLRIMGRLYYHMEVETAEQKMIESLAEHGVLAMDLVPALMTTHTVKNPEYDPTEAAQKEQQDAEKEAVRKKDEIEALEEADSTDPSAQELDVPPPTSDQPDPSLIMTPREMIHQPDLLQPLSSPTPQTTANILSPKAPLTMPGVTTSLSSTDQNVTLDIRWTVLCDLFLLLIADSVYDARSRVLLESIAAKMGLGWLDVVKFEKRVTDALEIQEGVEKMEQKEVIEGRSAAAQKKRYMMMGLATIGLGPFIEGSRYVKLTYQLRLFLGGGLVIGLSAGLLAPVIGAGLGAAFGTIGITGTTAFLGSAGGAAVITTGGVLTGSGIATKAMARRTQQVRTFDLLPIHNNKRVNCFITVTGFMSGVQDDPRLPFSVLDPVVGDVFSVLWEPEMMAEMGNALKILTSEILSQVTTTVLQATVMTALMSALQWPLVLTRLGYLIDNPWSNALDRARACGLVLADVLMNRSLGVRPISLIGFSLGARVIFYAMLELAKNKAYGVVQDVFLLGTTVTAPTKSWHEARSVISGRFVNAYARNDWVLNYLFRATSGGLNTVAGLRPVDHVPGLENVDVTDKIAGHMSYRIYMPVILHQLGFPVTADYFDEPEDMEEMWEREAYIKEQQMQAAKPPAKKRFTFFKRSASTSTPVTPLEPSLPPLAMPPKKASASASADDEDDLPARMEKHTIDIGATSASPLRPSPVSAVDRSTTPEPHTTIPARAGFDFQAIGKAIGKEDLDPNKIRMPKPSKPISTMAGVTMPLERSESAPPPIAEDVNTPRGSPRPATTSLHTGGVSASDVPSKFIRSTTAMPAASFSTLPQPPQFNTPRASSSWLPQPDDPQSAYAYQAPSGYNHQTSQSLSFGGADGGSSFAPSSSPPALSFGLPDGSISTTSLADPWSPSKGDTAQGKGRQSSLNNNPWA